MTAGTHRKPAIGSPDLSDYLAVLNAAEHAIMLVDPKLELVPLNVAATTFLSAVESTRRRERLLALLQEEAQGRTSAPFSLGEGHVYRVTWVPLDGARYQWVIFVRQEVARSGDVFRLLASLGATRRECEVFLSKRSGDKAAVVASRLGMSARTLERHLFNLYRRVGVHNFTELEALVRKRLVELSEPPVEPAR